MGEAAFFVGDGRPANPVAGDGRGVAGGDGRPANPAAGDAVAEPARGLEGRRAPTQTWVAAASELRAWARRARAGERFCYCSGPVLVKGPAARAAAALARDGVVLLVQEPGLGAWLWLAERRPGVGRSRRRALAVRDPLAARVLSVLRREAAARRPASSDRELQQRLGIATRATVTGKIRKLVRERRIACETMVVRGCAGAGPVRVVTILANGNRTREPGHE